MATLLDSLESGDFRECQLNDLRSVLNLKCEAVVAVLAEAVTEGLGLLFNIVCRGHAEYIAEVPRTSFFVI